MNKAEREDANKALFGPKLRVRLRKLTMAKAPVTAKKGSRKKETSPRLVAIPDIPSISSPIRPSSPKIPSSSMQSTQSYLKSPGVPLPHLPPLPKFPAVSLPSLTSLPKFPTVTMPSMPSLPSIPEIEAILSTPFQFVASLWPSFMSPSNLMTYYSSEENSSSTQSEGESSGSRLRQYCSAQNLFNFSASSLRFPSALKLYELSLLKSFSSPETKDTDESVQDELEGASRPKRRRSEENGLKSNDMTNDQMVKILSDFLSNCDCNAKTKLLQQFSEQPEKSDKLHLHRSLSEESLCKICMESPMDCVLLECGHIVSCLQCGSLLKQCPICRQAVERVVRTFRS